MPLLLTFGLCSLLYAQRKEEGISFIENKGQWGDDVLYRAFYLAGYVDITNKGYRVIKGFVLPKHANLVEVPQEKSPMIDQPPNYQYRFYEVQFENISFKISHRGVSEQVTIYNYYKGIDPTKWGSGCKGYGSVVLENVYSKIDIKFYYINDQLKYDFIIHPDANPQDITLNYILDENSSLSIKRQISIDWGNGRALSEKIPQCYQKLPSGRRSNVRCTYEKIGPTQARFNLGHYNKKATLVIDPAFTFSTFSGSKAHSLSYCSSFDKEGNFLSGSIVWQAGGFPITSGNTDYNPNNVFVTTDYQAVDMGIMRLSKDGRNNLFATVIGSEHQDNPLSIKEASDGSILVAGKTRDARSFPGQQQSAIGNTGGYDIVVVKLSSTGKLINSIVIGGSSDDAYLIRQVLDNQSVKDPFAPNRPGFIWGDVAGLTTVFDKDDNLILTTCTESNDFPILGTPAQSSHPAPGRHAGVLVKLSLDLKTVFFSGYTSGNAATAPFDIAYNNGQVYVVGATRASTMPNAKNTSQGDIDGYMMQIENKATGYAIISSRFFGTSSNNFDALYNIHFDEKGFPYVIGSTNGQWPIKNVSFSQAGGKHFIAKYQKDFSSAIYSTRFGPNSTSPALTISSFLVDRCENVYVAGWGGNAFIQNSWVPGLPIKAEDGTLRSSFDASGDYYIAVFEKNINSVIYAGYLGAHGIEQTNDHFHYGENQFDEEGILYQTVCVCAGEDNPQPNFPVFPTSASDVWSVGVGRNRNSPSIPFIGSASILCNAAFVKLEFLFGGVKATLYGSTDDNTYTQNVQGCVPIEVTLVDRSLASNKGKKFYWFFEDENTEIQTVEDNIKHTFTQNGVNRVRLIAEDLASCNERDTSYMNIIVREGTIELAYTAEPLNCTGNSLDFRFLNTTRSSNRSTANTQFIWDFGDGSPTLTTTGPQSVTHTYGQFGEYKVSLSFQDPLFCNIANSESTVSGELTTNITHATAVISDRVCVESPVSYENKSKGYTKYIIDWGDGQTDELGTSKTKMQHTYTKAGTYVITSTASIPSCNKHDVNAQEVTILPKPIPNFDFFPKGSAPNTTKENKRIIFENLSQNASKYQWDFGDGTTSTNREPSHLFTSTKENKVKLIAISAAGCADSITKTLLSTFTPKLGVASAFSPNGDGINDKITVDGFGIKSLLWKIYTQRGDLVYETNNVETPAWDGKNQSGEDMPSAVYIYSLIAVFHNDDTKKISGEITLLR